MFMPRKQCRTRTAGLQAKAEAARRDDIVNARIMILSILRKHGLTLADFDWEVDSPKPPRPIEKIDIKD